jgi:hypothetical protein
VFKWVVRGAETMNARDVQCTTRCTSVCVCVRACGCACVRACVRRCVRACVRASVCMRTRAFVIEEGNSLVEYCSVVFWDAHVMWCGVVCHLWWMRWAGVCGCFESCGCDEPAWTAQTPSCHGGKGDEGKGRNTSKTKQEVLVHVRVCVHVFLRVRQCNQCTRGRRTPVLL